MIELCKSNATVPSQFINFFTSCEKSYVIDKHGYNLIEGPVKNKPHDPPKSLMLLVHNLRFESSNCF